LEGATVKGADEQFALLEMLLERKVLTTTNVELLKKFIAKWRVNCYDAVTETKLVAEDDLKDHIAAHFSCAKSDNLASIKPTSEALESIGFVEACRLVVLPLDVSKQKLKMAVADPNRLMSQNGTFSYQGRAVDLQIAGRSEIMRAIYAAYPAEQQLSDLMVILKGKA